MSRKQVLARARKHKQPVVAFKALKALGDEKMQVIDERLLAGDSCALVVDLIQQEWGDLDDMSAASVKKMLERYRGSELREKTLARIAGAQKMSEISVINHRLNALDEMDNLVRLQRARVEKILVREADLPNGILLKDASFEMRLLKDTLTDLGRLQLETGVLARAPKTVKGTITDSDGQVREFAWTEEQEELMRTLENVERRALPHGEV